MDECIQRMLAWRALKIENVCPDCDGSGKKTYGNTTTFHGGIGGQALTTDVCDKCWGSGDKESPWPDWRKYENA